MSSYDDMAGSEQDVADHPDHNFKDRVRLAGDVVPLSPNNTNTWQNAGPAAANPVQQVIKILAAPRTGNVQSIKTGNTIR